MKKITSEITRYMRSNMEKNISIEELATLFGYSKFHFSREFKKQIGVSPNEYWAGLRIEKMYLELNSNDSVLYSHLKAGYLSSGTFSNTFLDSTGMTPTAYRKSLNQFYKAMHLHEHTNENTYNHYSFDASDYRTFQKYHLKVHVGTPTSFEGTIFVGLFNRPIPNHTPVVGKAMLRSKSCLIDQIPDGKYYVLACGIPKGSSPITYFHLDSALRELSRTPVVFPLAENTEMFLQLREKRDDDPPIPINPVNLLLNAIKNRNLE